MVRQFMKDKMGQNTAEYALLIALVVAGIIAMQTYAQRALQARVRDGSVYLTQQTNAIGNTYQYEPQATQSNYEVSKESESNKRLAAGTVAADESTNRVRESGGYQKQTYNAEVTVDNDGAVKSGL